MIDDEMPRALNLTIGLPPVGGSRRKSAGTKTKCIFCGKPTYRFITNKAVCSYCASTPEAESVKLNW